MMYYNYRLTMDQVIYYLIYLILFSFLLHILVTKSTPLYYLFLKIYSL